MKKQWTTVLDFIQHGKVTSKYQIVEVQGMNTVGDGGALTLVRTGAVGTPSQSFTDTGNNTCVDKNGDVWGLQDGTLVTFNGTDDWFGNSFGLQEVGNYELKSGLWSQSETRISKGEYTSGITLESKFEYITYNDKPYFATNPPYTTTATMPDADSNLIVGNYLSESDITALTDVVYKPSVSNSPVDNMIAEMPISLILGDKASCIYGTEFIKVSNSIPQNESNFMVTKSEIFLEDFGVIYGSESTTNASIINNLIQNPWSNSGVVFVITGELYFDSQLLFNTGTVSLKFRGKGKLIYTGVNTQPAVVIGSEAFSTNLSVKGFKLDNQGDIDYNEDESTGLRLIRVKSSDIDIRRIAFFTNNLQLWGSSDQGIEHNTFRLGSLWNAKRFIDIVSATVTGYVNENLFIAGNMQNTTAYPLDMESIGCEFRTVMGGTYKNHNNNVWLKPCFQLAVGVSPTAERIPVKLNNSGVRNSWIEARVEGFNGPVMDVISDQHQVRGNSFQPLTLIGGDINDRFVRNSANGLGFDNLVKYRSDSSETGATWSSGALSDNCKAFNVGRLTSSTVFFQDENSDVELNAGIAELLDNGILIPGGRGCGVWVDTRLNKDFSYFVSESENNVVKATIVAYDSNGDILTDAGPNHPYVLGAGDYNAAKYGGGYSSTSGFSSEGTIRVQEDVKKIKIIVDESNVVINNIQVTAKAYSRSPSGISVYSGVASTGWSSQDNPATIKHGGYATRGDIRQNANIDVGLSSFWQCTLSGYNPDNWTTTTDYIVGQLVENSGNAYVCITEGTSGMTGPSGTGSGVISDGSAEWKYKGGIATWIDVPLNFVFTATTAQLESASSDINSVKKTLYKQVTNTDTMATVRSAGVSATSSWRNADGSVAHSPS